MLRNHVDLITIIFSVGGVVLQTLNMFYNDYRDLSEFVRLNSDVLVSPNQTAVLVQIFSGRYEKQFLAKLSAEITGLIPHAQIIGATTTGEIMNGQVSVLRTVLSFSVFEQTSVRVSLFPKDEKNDFELGRSVAVNLGSDKAKVLILFSTGISVKAKEMLMGVNSVNPNLYVAGGNASKSSIGKQSFLVCNGQIIDSGIVGAVLEGEHLLINSYSHLGWQPIGKEMTITKAEGLRVYTIDSMPAYDVYRKYLGSDNISNFPNVREFPLIVTRNGIPMARTPDIQYKDGSIGFAADLIEQEKVRFSFGHVGLISEAMDNLCQKIRQQPVESIFVYSCECRRGFLQELSKIETEPLQQIAPTAGFFTHGEFFYAGGINQLLNATMTVLVLSESGRTCIETSNILQYDSSKKDEMAEGNIGVLKALTHLVDTVTAELVAANEKLSYISLHDPLTGLYNRTFFEQEMARFETENCQAGIIVCDLDFLKTLNDVLGHTAGDKALMLAADIIASSCPANVTICRIGGDEFAILAANADLNLLIEIRASILNEAARRRRLNNEKMLFLSVGIGLKAPDAAKTMRDAFVAADSSMYRHKLAHKKRVRKNLAEVLPRYMNGIRTSHKSVQKGTKLIK